MSDVERSCRVEISHEAHISNHIAAMGRDRHHTLPGLIRRIDSHGQIHITASGGGIGVEGYKLFGEGEIATVAKTIGNDLTLALKQRTVERIARTHHETI